MEHVCAFAEEVRSVCVECLASTNLESGLFEEELQFLHHLIEPRL